MQPLKPGKDETNAISRYGDIQDLRQYLVPYHINDINVLPSHLYIYFTTIYIFKP